MDAIEASEEWNAAMESEIMKGPKRQGTRGRLEVALVAAARALSTLERKSRPIETRGRDFPMDTREPEDATDRTG